MKLLAAGDFHGKNHRFEAFRKAIETYEPDLALVCGDITHFGPKSVAKEFLDSLPVRTFAIPGNLDPKGVNQAIDESSAINLHERRIEQNGFSFIGLGGSTPGIFSYQAYTEAQIYRILEGLALPKSILLAHVPPYGIQDEVRKNKHLGSKAIRKWIELHKPVLAICAHIHEAPGYSKLDETLVVNCSIGMDGIGTFIEIGKEVKVKMIGYK
jgi:hypothetical protein